MIRRALAWWQCGSDTAFPHRCNLEALTHRHAGKIMIAHVGTHTGAHRGATHKIAFRHHRDGLWQALVGIYADVAVQ